ncbi:PTS system, cellobiose-specific IIC component [Williamsoniiplasma somnilux]|uniref:PTS system, cellobiose-specific IIC component n=1 Tax=Williamsoniiplasma somnilux TaxID=215578 RepID=A0A2K8NYU2_9MOLU|nr:PTS transporter subunit EIIC [Williamsoniiplasma somnilux]ATZ18914.1 PTS system, cellobiose-specific IIC component [Williamsoniiplasma somnilux]
MVQKFNADNSRNNPQGFKIWFQQKFIPQIAKMGNQRHLAAIRDSFGTMIPLIIAGSLGVLINAIIFGGAGSGYVSLLGLFAKAANPDVAWNDLNAQVLGTGGWAQTTQIMGYAFGIINSVTVGMMAIWFSFLLGYYIAISRNFQNPLVTGLLSGSAFMLASLGEVTFFMGAQGLITAILFGILSTELFIKLSSVRALNIKLPDGVPPAVGKSFAVFLPVCITLSVVAMINVIVLAPAIVTGDLKVTANTYSVMDSGQFAELFNKQFVAADFLKANPNFANYSDIINKIADNWGTNQKAFVEFYNSQSSQNQSVIATAIATFSGAPGSGSAIAEVADKAKIIFVVGKNANYLATLSWFKVALGPNQFGMGAAIYQFFTSWFIGFATGSGGIGLAIVFVFAVSFFWFFGVHGSNLMAGIFEPIFWMVLGINTALVTSLGYDAAVATQSMGVFTKPFFDAYMYVGGSGATLGLLLMTLSFSKRKDLKEIAKYSTPAGVFQINEPTIFGFPLILNPVYVVPFILVPIINLFVGWIFSPDVLNFVKYSYVATPWTAPWFLGAMITSLDVRALLPAFIIFGIDLLLYLPFVLLDNKLYFKKLKENNIEQYNMEMKYYNDPEFKWNTDTETKFNNKINKGELVVLDAEETNAFWAKRMTDSQKLAIRQKDIMQKALDKQLKYNKEAKEVKAKRDAKIPELKTKWAKQKKKN